MFHCLADDGISNLVEIDSYYCITTDNLTDSNGDLTGTAGTLLADKHFYVITTQDEKFSNTRGDTDIKFANNTSGSTTYGFRTKYNYTGLAFKLKEGFTAEVRVYLRGASGTHMYLKHGTKSSLTKDNDNTFTDGSAEGKGNGAKIMVSSPVKSQGLDNLTMKINITI